MYPTTITAIGKNIMSRVIIFLVCALALLGMVHAEEAEAQGTILLQKTVTQEYPRFFGEGINFTVKIDLHNLGDGTAYNVTAHDDWPVEHFSVVEGTENATFEEIPA